MHNGNTVNLLILSLLATGMFSCDLAKTIETEAPHSRDRIFREKNSRCSVLDLEPGQKATIYGYDDHDLFYSTRPFRNEEAPERIVIMRANPGFSNPDCSFIVIEHALPASSASK